MKIPKKHQKLYDKCCTFCKNTTQSPSHNLNHHKRVLSNALWLVEKLRIDVDMPSLIAGALLHDISRGNGGHGSTQGLGSWALGRRFLETNLNNKSLELSRKIIVNHSIEKHGIRKSNEERIVYDADKLHGFGLRGYWRCFLYFYIEKKRGIRYTLHKMKHGMELRRQHLHFTISKTKSRKLTWRKT